MGTILRKQIITADTYEKQELGSVMLLTALIRLIWTVLHETACIRDETRVCCRQNGESRSVGRGRETRRNTRHVVTKKREKRNNFLLLQLCSRLLSENTDHSILLQLLQVYVFFFVSMKLCPCHKRISQD